MDKEILYKAYKNNKKNIMLYALIKEEKYLSYYEKIILTGKVSLLVK